MAGTLSRLFMAVVFVSLATTGKSSPIYSTDLWDISQGTVAGNNSGVLNYRSSFRSDIRDMFGGAFGTVEGGNTLFKDYNSPGQQGGNVAPGFTHFVEWHTNSEVTLRSFDLHASNEGMTRRAFNRFTLFSSSTSGGLWNTIYDTGAGFTYGPGSLDLAVNISPVVAQYFRAEFVQASWTDGRAVGPRIQELDGFDTFIAGIPNPIPLPAALPLFGAGLALMGFAGWRRKRIAATT